MKVDAIGRLGVDRAKRRKSASLLDAEHADWSHTLACRWNLDQQASHSCGRKPGEAPTASRCTARNHHCQLDLATKCLFSPFRVPAEDVQAHSRRSTKRSKTPQRRPIRE